MTMSIETTQRREPVKTGIFCTSKENTAHVEQLLKGSGVRQFMDVQYATSKEGDLTKAQLVLAIYSSGDNLEQYASYVASLKLIAKVPMVLSFVIEGAREVFEASDNEIAADRVLHLPAEEAEVEKLITTAMAAIRIEKSKRSVNNKFQSGAQSLGSILVENRVITPLQLKKALDYQKKFKNIMIGDALVALSFIDEFQKIHFLASQMGVQVATARQYASADMNVVSLVPEHIARDFTCMALEKHENVLVVVMLDVTNIRLLDSLRDHTDCEISPILGTKEDITFAVERYYADITTHKDASALMEDLGSDVEFVKNADEEIDAERAAAEGAELGIIKLVNMLIANAIRDRASDIHIEPGEHNLEIRCRIDGEMRRMMSPPKHSHQAIVTRLKILSDLNIAERRLPQDGRMVVRVGKREVDLRVSVLPTIHGEKVVLRILDKEAFKKSMGNLGFAAHEMKIFKENINRPYGMIIVTGPTGSGKSTTLYSALESVKSVTTNIITVEDPVEFHMENINQVHVNAAIGLTFAAALRSILRQDPDTILIGEIRDAETADIAIKMSLTGHMVFSTLHTNDAASAITRFVDIGVPPLLLTSSLNLIIAQRLVRTICSRCKKEYTPEPEFLEKLQLDTSSNGHKFYKGEGCITCNGTGYRGRIGLFEMLQISRDMRVLILRNAPSSEIQELAVKEGMKTLRQSGIENVLKGNTTIEQVLAVTMGI